MHIDTWPWSHTCWGHMVPKGPEECKLVKLYIFRLSYKLTSHVFWPLFVTLDPMNLFYMNEPCLVPIGLPSGLNFANEVNFIFWAHLTTWPLSIWPFIAWSYKGSHIVSIYKIQFQLDYNFTNQATFTFDLTSDDLWPWYITFDFTNKWGFPYCIYDPTLVENHQNMWMLGPNVNPFSWKQQTTGEKAIPVCLSC